MLVVQPPANGDKSQGGKKSVEAKITSTQLHTYLFPKNEICETKLTEGFVAVRK